MGLKFGKSARKSIWKKRVWQIHPELQIVYHTVKTFGGKNFGELKSICIGNVMEIVKIGEKSWQNAVICQIHQVFSPPLFFTIW